MSDKEISERFAGMSRRDWLAGLAMQGMLANLHPYQQWDVDVMSERCYISADSMIAEGKKE